MSRVPTVQIGRVLVATLGDELDDSGALGFQDDIGRKVVEQRATGVLLDISALDVVDSFIAKVLADTASIVSVLGARVALVGMQPAVAITLVELGLPLTGVDTALNLEHGLRAVSSPEPADPMRTPAPGTVNPAAVEYVDLRVTGDVVVARHRARELATAHGFDLVSQTKLVTAVSELARNALTHGLGGRLSIEIVESGTSPPRTGIVVEVIDDGPGIADLDLAMTGGWSTGKGLGLGLPGSKRLVHEFEIESAPGGGTRVRIVMWRRGR